MANTARTAGSRLFNDPGVTYMLAGAFTLAAISFFENRDIALRTVVGGPIAPYDVCWNVLYLIAGILVVISYIVRLRQIDPDGFEIPHRMHREYRWEAAALIALGGGFTLNGTTALALHGPADVRSYVFAFFIVGCILRFRRAYAAAR